MRAKACPYGASRLNAGVRRLRSGSRALHTLLTTRLSLARRTGDHHNLVVTVRPKMLACLGRRKALGLPSFLDQKTAWMRDPAVFPPFLLSGLY